MLGGSVIHYGKPEIATYHSCLDNLHRYSPQIEPAQVLAIGDGMATDILGAHRSGMASLLIEGTLEAEVRLNQTGPNDSVSPDFTMNALIW
jgi:ribonucleotide monophosphatase NagD (HAD superfamily)